MPWSKRGGKAYYYESVRRGGKAVKVYLGAGDQAESAAQEVAKRRAEREAERAAGEEAEERHQRALKPLLDLCEVTDLLMRAVLEGEGFRRHARGAWRKRRHE
jgi:hypothetical protein